MVDITFNCPHCGEAWSVEDDSAGLTVPCPSCNTSIQIPSTALKHPPPAPSKRKTSTTVKPDIDSIRRICRLSIASLVMGVLSLIASLFGPLLSIPAVILGHVARRRIRMSAGRLSGSRMALSGLILGYIHLGFFAVFLLVSGSEGFLGASAMKQEISSVTWSEVNAVYGLRSKHTDLQKKELWKRYRGKRVKWRGRVVEVDKTLGVMSLHITMGDRLLLPSILVQLRSSEKDKALNLKKGQTITFSGMLSDWGTIMPTTLVDGEIVEQQ